VSVETKSRSNLRLNEATGAIGGAVGSAVEEVRRLPERLEEMKARFTVIRGRAQEGAASKAADLKQAAREHAHGARSRAAYYAREYPLHVIAAVAGAGFALGIALRIWRSTRA
jgi:ElaB/YqjD/DUF883 family membrane-anchored ribosome-binding protein